MNLIGRNGSCAPIHELHPNEGDPAALLGSPPVSAPVAAFDGGADAALVVCGPQRVRMLLGTAGTPGLVPLLLARCAAGLEGAGGSAGVYGLSVFFALPEGDDTNDVADHTLMKLPVIDALDGMESRHGWERCAMETFTDVHKIFGTLVRILAGGPGKEAAAMPSAAGEAARRQNRYLGRFPLVFRISLLSTTHETRVEEPTADELSSDKLSGVVSKTGSTSVACRSLLLVDAPSAVAAGPVPAAYRRTTELLKFISCCVLHAAAGDAPTDIAPIRAALGPLQMLLEEGCGPGFQVAVQSQVSESPLLPVPCDMIADQAARAARDLASLLSMREKARQAASVAASGGSAPPGCGTAAIPPADLAAAWRASFGLREITTAEVQRQLPLACERAMRLHLLLETMGSLSGEERSTLQQLMRCVEPLRKNRAETAHVNIAGDSAESWLPKNAMVEIATLAWQRQWQAQQLMGRLDTTEEIDTLRAKVTMLTQSLEESRSVNSTAMARERICKQARESDLQAAHEELLAVRKALEVECREVQARAGESENHLIERLNAERAQVAELSCELEFQHVQELSSQRHARAADELAEQLKAELLREEGRSCLLSEELIEAQQRIRKWRSDNHGGVHSARRTRELEGVKQRLMRELRETRQSLEAASSEKDRALSMLRRESANCAAAQRRGDSLAEEVARLQAELQLHHGAADTLGEPTPEAESQQSASIEAAIALAKQMEHGGSPALRSRPLPGSAARYPSCPPRLTGASVAANVATSSAGGHHMGSVNRRHQVAKPRAEPQTTGLYPAASIQRPASAGSSGSRRRPSSAGSDRSRAGQVAASRRSAPMAPSAPNARVAQLLITASAAASQSACTPPRIDVGRAREAAEVSSMGSATDALVDKECTEIEESLNSSCQWLSVTANPEGELSAGVSRSTHLDLPDDEAT